MSRKGDSGLSGSVGLLAARADLLRPLWQRYGFSEDADALALEARNIMWIGEASARGESCSSALAAMVPDEDAPGFDVGHALASNALAAIAYTLKWIQGDIDAAQWVLTQIDEAADLADRVVIGSPGSVVVPASSLVARAREAAAALDALARKDPATDALRERSAVLGRDLWAALSLDEAE